MYHFKKSHSTKYVSFKILIPNLEMVELFTLHVYMVCQQSQGSISLFVYLIHVA